MSTIRDVARQAGVSIATVSRVLNKNPRVKPHLRTRVEQAIRELNYQPSALARGMRSQTAQILGVIVPDIQDPFFASLARAVEDTAYENQYNLLLCSSDKDPSKELGCAEMMLTQRVAGLILVPASTALCQPLQESNVPLVFAVRPLAAYQVDTVLLDSELGGRLATEHLIELGHRRIGLISVSRHGNETQECLAGYQTALADAQVPFDPNLVRHGDLAEEGAYQRALELLNQEQPPTALLVTGNYLATRILQAIQARGMRIPGDLALVIVGDVPGLSMFQPSMTVVRQPIYGMGQEAASLLLRRIRGEAPQSPLLVRLAPELIVGESTASPRA